MNRSWSEMSPDELLDAAQEMFEETARQAPNANGLHGGLIRATALATAAHTRALMERNRHERPV